MPEEDEEVAGGRNDFLDEEVAKRRGRALALVLRDEEVAKRRAADLVLGERSTLSKFFDAVLDGATLASQAAHLPLIEEGLKRTKAWKAAAAIEAARPLTDAEKRAELRANKEKFVKTVRFAHQCLMFYNVAEFSLFHKESKLLERGRRHVGQAAIGESLYEKMHLMSGEDTFVINNLNSCQNSVNLAQKIRNLDLSLLSPKLRIYKYFPFNGEKQLVEFEFPRETEEAQYSSVSPRTFRRGNLAGVKSFEYSYNGSNSFTATRDLEATLVMHFQSFDAIMEEHNTPEGATWRYLDLFTQAKCAEGKQTQPSQNPAETKKIIIGNRAYQPECFEIMVDVGYAKPTSEMLQCFATEELKEDQNAVECFNTTLFLTVVDHTIDIREDGTIDVTVNYRARLEATYRDTRYDILYDYGNKGTSLEASLIKIEKELKNDALSDEDRSKKKANKDKILQQRQKKAFNNIITKLLEKDQLYFTDLEQVDIDSYLDWISADFDQNSQPPLLGQVKIGRATERASTDALVAQATLAASDDEDIDKEAEDEIASIKNITASRDRRLKFVYFGDFMNVAIEIVENNIANILKGDPEQIARFDRTKFLLPSVVIDTPVGIKTVNMAHLPISFDTLTTFLINKIVKPRREFFSFIEFIRSVIGELIVEVLGGDCFISTGKKQYRSGMAYFYAQPNGKSDPLDNKAAPGLFDKEEITFEDYLGNPDVGTIAYVNPSGLAKHVTSYRLVKGHKDPYEYICIYNRLLIHGKMKGNIKEDNANNIVHFAFGLDRGLIKSVKFQKTDQPFLQEARYRQKGDHILGQLSNVYEVTFEMHGNNLFIPGQYIYYDPFTLSDELGKPTNPEKLANIMGLGGYHLITQINCRIEPGKFKTTAKGRWVTSGVPKNKPVLNSELGESVLDEFDDQFPESLPLDPFGTSIP